MKLKRFFSLGLSAALLLSMLAVPASAAKFSDITGRFAWAAPYAEDLADKGIAKGYDDGLYHPDEQLTAVQALAFCARILQLDNATKTAMVSEFGAQATALLPSGQSWASAEVVICLGAGILTMSELRTLCTSGAISKPIAKEDLAMYLVRAMQLENQALSLTSYSLGYTDTSSISANRKAYVYLLGQYGVVEGNDKNQFEPKSYVNRAVMAAMLSRAMDAMESKSIAIDLPAYQNYNFVAGMVKSSTTNSNGTITMVISSDVSGSKAVTMAANTPIYLNKVGTTASSITAGQYAKVALNSSNVPSAVYLDNSVTSYTGTVSSITQESLSMVLGGTTRTFSFDRCTEVKTSSSTGGPSIISSTEKYTQVTVQAGSSGLAVSVVLTGGETQQKGLVGGVSYTTAGTVLTVTGFDGVDTELTLAAGASILVDGVTGTLSTVYVGDYVQVSVSNDTGKVTAVNIDTTTRFVQGYIRQITNTTATRAISLVRFDTGGIVNYNVDDACVTTYQNESILFGKLKQYDVVTVELDRNGYAVRIDSYPGTVVTEGTIEDVEYGVTTILKVKRTDGVTVNFELNMNDLPSFTRNGVASTVDKLVVGDAVSVTVRYNYVTAVSSTGQETNAKGTISSITTNLEGTTLNVKLDNGQTASYPLVSNVVITYNGAAVALSSLKPGDTIAMVVSGDRVVSIEVLSVTSSSTELNGTVLSLDSVAGTILFMLTDNTLVTVRVPSTASIISTTGGSVLLGSLKAGNLLTIYGNYSGAEFVATVIIRK